MSPVAIITSLSQPLQFCLRQLRPLVACTFSCTPHCLQVYQRLPRSMTSICPQDSHLTMSLFLRWSWVARCRVSLGQRIIRVNVGCCIIIICSISGRLARRKLTRFRNLGSSIPKTSVPLNTPSLCAPGSALILRRMRCKRGRRSVSTTVCGNLDSCFRMISDAWHLVLIIMADFKHGLAGGVAGIAVDLVFYPLETIKTRIMGSSPGENFTSIARSKFKGFSCQMVVSFPYSFTFFYTYETIRWLLPNNPIKNVLASVCAEILANMVRNPFEVVKQQLMVGRSQKISHSLIQIARQKGISGFYVGYKSTIARDIVFSAFQLPIFEYLRQKNYLQLSSVANASLSGAIAALISGFVSCPLDVLKTRLMTRDMKLNKAQDIVAQIYREAGMRAFFKGVGFRCSILCLGGVVYFGALQRARTFFHVQ